MQRSRCPFAPGTHPSLACSLMTVLKSQLGSLFMRSSALPLQSFKRDGLAHEGTQRSLSELNPPAARQHCQARPFCYGSHNPEASQRPLLDSVTLPRPPLCPPCVQTAFPGMFHACQQLGTLQGTLSRERRLLFLPCRVADSLALPC